MIRTYEYKPIKYFALTFIITFALWFTGGFVSFSEGRGGLYMLFMLPGLLAPFIISLVMTYRSGNHELKKDFLNRLVNIKLVQLGMLPAIFLLMPLAVLVSIGISLLFGGSVEQFQLADGFSFSASFMPVLLVLILAAAFEELGWRGYAFDSLQSRFSILVATIIFSLLWSVWHLPLLVVKDSYQYEIMNQNIWFAVNFYISIIPMGIILTWVCLRNRKSIIAAILFHFIINMSQETLAMTQVTKCIETVVLFIVAGAIIFLDQGLFRPTSSAQKLGGLQAQADRTRPPSLPKT